MVTSHSSSVNLFYIIYCSSLQSLYTWSATLINKRYMGIKLILGGIINDKLERKGRYLLGK